MAVKGNLISVRDAALEKGVSRQAIYKALDEGRIREVALGGIRLVKKDRKYDLYNPRPYGGRRVVETNGST